MQCPCGNPIYKDQYAVETPEQWEKRKAQGVCRAKCARIYAPKKDRPKPSLELVSMNYERPELVPQEKELPVRDEARKAFVRSMPCFTCGEIEGIHAHHEQEEGHGVMAGKVSDRRTIPLCPACHRLRHDTSRSFWGNVDVEAYIRDLNEAYDTYGKGAK